MLPAHAAPLTPADLTRLDDFLHSHACGRDAMGLSHAHGFLTAAVSGPETLEAAEWIRLMFDEPVFDSGEQAQEMLGLALRLYRQIEHTLDQDGQFRPVLEYVRTGAGDTRVEATAWCQGFISGMTLGRERWARRARSLLAEPLALIFRLAEAHRVGTADYAQWCAALPLAAEVVYRYWRADAAD
jgi:yecA family protein